MSQDENGESIVPPNVAAKDVLPVTSESESLDAVFRALSDHRRRCVCHYLVRTDEPMAVRDLAELVAASMSEKTHAVLTSAEIEQTRTELDRLHLPKLAEVGIVEWDEEKGVVRLADSPGVAGCLNAAADVDLR